MPPPIGVGTRLNILSIQSHVAYGHVGNSGVVLPLQRLGHEVWPVHTVMLSNHAGYPDTGGSVVPAAELSDVINALDRRGALELCDGVLSGYLGDVATGDVMLDAVARVRAKGRRTIYCCDPVMGDDGAIYVDAGIPRFMRERAAPTADVLTPNLFELSVLTDSSPDALTGAPLGDIVAASRKLMVSDRRTSVVLVTSLAHSALGPSDMAMAAVTSADAWVVTTPKLSFETSPHGAGDCCAALFCAALLEGLEVAPALSRTASALYGLLEETAKLGRSELALVEAQDFIVAPPRMFEAASLN